MAKHDQDANRLLTTLLPEHFGTYLCLSTEHLEYATMQELERIAAFEREVRVIHSVLSIADYLFGVFVVVPDPLIDNEVSKVGKDLLRVLRYTQQKGAQVVWFSANGATLADLPIYQWP